MGGQAAKFATTTTSSTFVGHKAGLGIEGTPLTGNNNTAIGQQAGLLLQGTAASNTLVGATAGDNITTGDSNIIIGSGIDAQSATADGQINIGGIFQYDGTDITLDAAGTIILDGS